MESKQLKWVYLVVLALVWEVFILIKKRLGLTALQLGHCAFFSAIFLMIIGFRSLAKIPKFKWKYIALTSMFGTFIPAYLCILLKHRSIVL
jgi:hypothetical protein